MKILIVAATHAEAEVISQSILPDNDLIAAGLELEVVVTGIGSAATISSMYRWFIENGKPDLAINIGIAGSFNEAISTGDVVIPVRECHADLGIEDHDSFLTLAEAGLADPDSAPYREGWLHADGEILSKLPSIKKVVSITVNTATGSEGTINKLRRKYNPDIETMEGASFFYVCRLENIPFIAIRSISNRIEPRNRDNWNVVLALNNLKACLSDVLLTFEKSR